MQVYMMPLLVVIECCRCCSLFWFCFDKQLMSIGDIQGVDGWVGSFCRYKLVSFSFLRCADYMTMLILMLTNYLTLKLVVAVPFLGFR